MDLSLDDTQQLVRNSARDFLAESVDRQYVRDMEDDERGYSDEFWKSVAELGWTGMIVPEQHGGAGMSLIELSLVLEEMGAAAAPGPFFSTAVVGAHAISTHGNDDQKNKYLPGLVKGELITSLAMLEGSASWAPGGIRLSAQRSEDGWRLNGEKVFVADAGAADLFIVAARTDENGPPEESITLFLVDSSAIGAIKMERLESVADDRYYVVGFKDVIVPPDGVLGEVDGGWPLLKQTLDLAAVAKCAEMVGGSRKAVDMMLEYVKERVQFGRPIGTFQAVQHRAAEMATDLEIARQFTYRAAWALSEGKGDGAEVATAKAFLSEKFSEICSSAHQLHGAIGFTREHDLHIYSRRAASAKVAFGDARHHREVLAGLMGL